MPFVCLLGNSVRKRQDTSTHLTSHNGRYAEHTAAKTGNISNPVGSVRRLLVDFWRIVAAILLPPLGVFLQVGLTKHFWINILLTLLGYIPGIVHAVWVIAKY